MILLAIETSQRPGSLALFVDGRLLGECAIETQNRRQAQSIVVVAQELLNEHALAINQVDSVACSLGPGSFTGLRVGLTFAKTLAYANKGKLIGVSTMAVLAAQLPEDAIKGTVIVNAQRAQLFTQQFQRHADSWQPVTEIEIRDVNDVIQMASPNEYLIGLGCELLSEEQLAQLTTVAEEFQTPQAATVGQLGYEKLIAGQHDNLAVLEPLYIRRSAAEEKATLNTPAQ